MAYRVTTAPTTTPISVREAAHHCDYLDDDRDADFEALIEAAVEVVEEWEWRSVMTQTLLITLDRFPTKGDDKHIYVPRPRLRTVAFLKYYDTAGVLQTWDAANYTIDTESEPGRIRPASSTIWPTPRPGIDNAIQIEVTAGYGTPDNVPRRTKLLTKLLVKHFFLNPSVTTDVKLADLPMGADALLRPAHNVKVLEFV